MASWIQNGGGYTCPRCGASFPNEYAAKACSCRTGYGNQYDTGKKKCPSCNGTGHKYGNSQIMCTECGGTGKVAAW